MELMNWKDVNSTKLDKYNVIIKLSNDGYLLYKTINHDKWFPISVQSDQDFIDECKKIYETFLFAEE